LQETLKLSEDNVNGILQLALNSSSQRVRLAAMTKCAIPGELDADTARRLVLTAALRRCHKSVDKLTSLTAVQEHIDACLLEEALCCMAEAADATTPGWKAYSAHSMYAILPDVAAALSSDAVFKLLGAAAKRCWMCTTHLCTLPAIQQLGSDQLSALLDTGMTACNIHCIQLLCSLPAAQQINVNVVSQLLAIAAKHSMWSLHNSVCAQRPSAACRQRSRLHVIQ
jgi:hypothetical protein